MTGKITFVPGPEDQCRLACPDKPSCAALKPRTPWTCDYCGKVWVVVEGAQYNEVYRSWRRLTHATRDGRDL